MPQKGRGGHNNTRHRGKPKEMIRADKSIEQKYAKITDLRGNRQFTAETIEGDKKHCSIRGALQRVKMRVGDLVLIEPLSDDLNGKYQIMFRYTTDQQSTLSKEGALNTVEQEEESDDEPEEAFVFESQLKENRETNTIDIGTNFIDGI